MEKIVMVREKITVFAALSLAASLLLSACSNSVQEPEAPSPDESPTEEITENIISEITPVPVPPILASQPEPTPTPEPTTEPGPDVPAQPEPAGDEYFDDAAFIGNSLVDGFRLFSGLTNCDVYAATSMTIMGIGDYITQMSSIEYGKIYMLLGINEIGYDVESFKKTYGDAIDRLLGDHPDALLYIMGISPVSAAKDASSDVFTMANVKRFNEKLYELADEKDCYYIDLCDALAGSDGFLPADVTTDGIHFTAAEYTVWLNYLREHYIPVVEEETPPPSPDFGNLPLTHDTPPPLPPEKAPDEGSAPDDENDDTGSPPDNAPADAP